MFGGGGHPERVERHPGKSIADALKVCLKANENVGTTSTSSFG